MASTFNNPLSMVRQLKGAPLSVFIACQIVRQVVSHRWLCEQTGYSDYAVTRAASYLTEHNLLAKVPGGWMIATAAQLPLMATLLEDGEGDEVVKNIPDENRGKRDSRSNSKIVSSEWLKDPVEIAACKAVLKDAGIFGKRADEIAMSEYATVDYIQSHLDLVQAEQWDNPVGMAIWRMLQGVPAPERQENGHIVGCECSVCKTRRTVDKYLGGRYAAYVNRDDDETEEP